MKIFFTSSFYGKKQYQKYYDLVLDTILKFEKDIISPELGNYLKTIKDSEKRKIRDLRTIHYLAVKKGIQQADAVIIEISHQDFQLGHEATLAIQSKKPVLCLSISEDMSLKVKDRYFYGAKYNAYSIDEIIENFIKQAKKSVLSQRFNLFLSPTQLKHVELASLKSGMNKSEYIRGLIDNDRTLKKLP
ncbi:MAG: hypothetical protein UT34_C0001G0429 [candidate division WS6 bacterium GW2011_GWF2_39_15]|uniref:Nucleoside 2-deoxyribosyltransferase n=1 Tax=candidate division WS6 bacterium GW2011_GWF2_39_15 TaxID=1619100 RepID=A0A0G0MQT3_9BACT|nr:MAG: hypothetical protein UT34_C0001G0429 [candidate division WS6 bacterium GW2011_GWF2_39_15]